jgi:ATP synthase F1 complex assembly factor 2
MSCSFHQDDPPPLVALQKEHWEPLLHWACKTFDVQIYGSKSLLLNAQPEATKQKFDKVLAEFDHWEMAGASALTYCRDDDNLCLPAMERVTHTTKSFIIALALVKGHLSVEQAALAAQVEVSSQIERWGEVEDSK